VIDALGVNELDGTNKLHHEVAHMLSLQRTLVIADGLVKVTVGAVLQDKVDVVLRLERLKHIDNIRVLAKAKVDTKLFRAFIYSKSRRAVHCSRRLGDTFDGNKITGGQVLSREDHAKGAMVQSRDSFVSAM